MAGNAHLAAGPATARRLADELPGLRRPVPARTPAERPRRAPRRPHRRPGARPARRTRRAARHPVRRQRRPPVRLGAGHPGLQARAERQAGRRRHRQQGPRLPQRAGDHRVARDLQRRPARRPGRTPRRLPVPLRHPRRPADPARRRSPRRPGGEGVPAAPTALPDRRTPAHLPRVGRGRARHRDPPGAALQGRPGPGRPAAEGDGPRPDARHALPRTPRPTRPGTPAGDGTTDLTELLRHEEPVTAQPTRPNAPLTPALSTARVSLGALGEFLVARGALPERRLRRTLADAVENGSLDETWLDWQEEAAVEIALPIGADSDRRGHYYTFLPLGDDVAAPLRAHVNAPFFTKMDRTALDREHPLNAMLLHALAETCLLAAELWRTTPGDGHRHAAVDILGWEPNAQSAGLLATAAGHVHRRPFAEVPLVPVLDGDTADAWRSPRKRCSGPPTN
ncbi:hypothetical protein KCH_10830 [Kitasatospora cheerisanensis KCTC 2395]|uniref:Uncharacterized protein n=1 Tax=Kitasatospora cheerisanensis KCTC 2395 TaxID=1348663 RepID=A0A066YZM7_9ACTN|nr:hypothetical protein KCH_10830 [Kitasatospora cheerisanensis KCTC 2395]